MNHFSLCDSQISGSLDAKTNKLLKHDYWLTPKVENGQIHRVSFKFYESWRHQEEEFLRPMSILVDTKHEGDKIFQPIKVATK